MRRPFNFTRANDKMRRKLLENGFFGMKVDTFFIKLKRDKLEKYISNTLRNGVSLELEMKITCLIARFVFFLVI